MSKSKTQIEDIPSLFEIYDYYNEKGELESGYIYYDESNDRYRDQSEDRAILQGQGDISGTSINSQDQLSSDTRGTRRVYGESEIRRFRTELGGFEHTRGDMGTQSPYPREEDSKNTNQSADGVLFRSQDMGYNRTGLADNTRLSQSASVGDVRRIDNGQISSSMDNRDSLAMGKTSLSQSDKSSGLQQTNLSSRGATNSGDRSIYASITSTEYSESNTIRGIGDNGSKPESILPNVDGTREQIHSQPQQYMGDSSERTQGESKRGDLLEEIKQGV